MKIKIKLNNGRVPTKTHATDAGYDLYATSKNYDEYGNIVYGTSLNIEIPARYVGLIFPRSSVSKKPLALANAVGVIDPGYTGEIIAKFKPTPYFTSGVDTIDDENIDSQEYKIGDRVVQLIVLKTEDIQFEEVKELEETNRGDNGFGSSNQKNENEDNKNNEVIS